MFGIYSFFVREDHRRREKTRILSRKMILLYRYGFLAGFMGCLKGVEVYSMDNTMCDNL